ncbi:MAG: TraB/GumN family protein [Pseudomonadota bacterium]
MRLGEAYLRQLFALIFVLFIGASLLPALAAPSSKSKNACQGRDLMGWLQRADPTAAARVQPTDSERRNDGAMLFEVSRPGVTTSYLFGTIHLTDPRVTQIPKVVAKALKSSRILALEVSELSPSATANAVAEAQSLVVFDDGQRLDQLLSKREFAAVKKKLNQSQTPDRLARMFKPWVISTILAVPECERRKIAKGKQVLDMRLAEIARKSSIPVVGLETIKAQLEASAAVPIDEQLQLLRASLAYSERAADLRETVLQLYLNRRMSYAIPLQVVLAEKAGIDGKILRNFSRVSIERRNQRMAKRAEKLLDAGGAFIAVGGMHLPGRNGLVALFKRAGYTLLPVD